MFTKKVYVERRRKLRDLLGSGVAVFLGNEESPMNYVANPYHFRQDSTFLYFFGLDLPGFAGWIDADSGEEAVFGNDVTIDDIVWMGPQPSVRALAGKAGVSRTGDVAELARRVEAALSAGRRLHFLPPYRTANAHRLQGLTGIAMDRLATHASTDLIRAVVALRSIKSDGEIGEIEKALEISSDMYERALKTIKPGRYEREIVGAMKGICEARGTHFAFPVILTVRGETLHNHHHGNRMKAGDLLVIDSGAESDLRYASDITRTFPVSGRFDPRQREIYDLVLASQLTAIRAIRPGVKYRDVHMRVARVLAQGLKDIGLMKGDIGEAVKAGAHALFFPHGLGHMMGLDVHDMEDLGENFVGYEDTSRRSDQFGLAYLRLARKLEPGFVLTVEPGLYFIPALIDLWKSEKKFTAFIDYARVETYKGFGGIRIEDDVLVTDKGCRVLGRPIPKTAEEIQEIMAGA